MKKERKCKMEIEMNEKRTGKEMLAIPPTKLATGGPCSTNGSESGQK